MNSPSESVLLSWSFLPIPALGLSLAAGIYCKGWRRLHRQVPARFPVGRLWAFLLGLLVLYVALASPLDAFASWLLMSHMVQHMLLTMVVPPLLLLGWPLLPTLSGLPRGLAREGLAPFLKSPLLHRIARFLVHPLFAGPLFMASNLAWHTPALYELALQNPAWHSVEHFCFLATGLLFWWPVVQPWPSRPIWPRWTMIPYLLIADIQNTALAAFLSFVDRVIYPTYAAAPRVLGISALDDQAGAGGIMWVPGSVIFLVPAGMIAMQCLTRPRPQATPPARIKSEAPTRRPFDLLRARWIGPLMRWKLFRQCLQASMFLLAGLVVLDGFLGPQVAPMNAAGVLPWTHWRAFTVVALLVAGNLFCMACPFTLARDFGRRFFSSTRHWPRWLRSKWLATGLLVLFFWAYEIFGLWNSPWVTAWIIVGYFVAAILVDGIFRGASFCKYVCPIGQFHFVSSLTSPLEVRVREADICATCRTHDCLRGNETQRGCELHLFQPRKSGNMDCTFCLDCVKACPHDNVGIMPVALGSDLIADTKKSSIGTFAQRPDLAVLALVFVSAAFVNAAGMVAPILRWQESLREAWGPAGSLAGISFLYILAVLVLPLGLALLCARVGCVAAGIRGAWRDVAWGFSMCLAPLGCAMWLAHFFFHLVTGALTPWPVFHRILADVGLVKSSPDWVVPSLMFAELPAVEILFLNGGLLFCLWILWKKSSALVQERPWVVWLPWALFALGLYAAGIWIIFQPMEMRGTFGG